MRRTLILTILLLSIAAPAIAVASPGDNPQRRGYDSGAPP